VVHALQGCGCLDSLHTAAFAQLWSSDDAAGYTGTGNLDCAWFLTSAGIVKHPASDDHRTLHRPVCSNADQVSPHRREAPPDDFEQMVACVAHPTALRNRTRPSTATMGNGARSRRYVLPMDCSHSSDAAQHRSNWLADAITEIASASAACAVHSRPDAQRQCWGWQRWVAALPALHLTIVAGTRREQHSRAVDLA
jgi:hypothetical protein